VATVTGIAFCCTILALAIVFSASERREWLLERGSLAARRSPLTDRRGHGLTVWPDGRSPMSRRTARSEVGRTTGFAGGAAPGQAEGRSEPGNTPRELQLLAGLRGVPPLGADTQLWLRPNEVWLDPRTAAATVRASLDSLDGRELPGIGGRSAASPDAAPGLGPHPRSAILLEREVFRLALRLTQLDHRIALVHVHVLVPLADPNDRRAPEMAFMATLESNALTADPNRLTDADLQNLFRDAWWVPPVR
jgi:hypothetical protein